MTCKPGARENTRILSSIPPFRGTLSRSIVPVLSIEVVPPGMKVPGL